MESKELRIGNLVRLDAMLRNELFYINEVATETDIFPVVQIDKMFLNLYINDKEYEFDLAGVNPIPLTKEWLVRFGFKIMDKVNIGCIIPINYEHQKEYLYCSRNGTVALWREAKQEEFIIKNSAKHVHQLQNLYYALTGKELEYSHK